VIPRVLAISPPSLGPWVDQLAALAASGVDSLILRLVEDPDGLDQVLSRGLPAGLQVLIRPVRPDDMSLARRAGLGLNLPASWDLRQRPPGAVPFGMSCHTGPDLARATALGANYALLSPVFAPTSKPLDRRPRLGLGGLGAHCRTATIPVLALGGVTAGRAEACLGAGAAGVAGIGAFFVAGSVDSVGAAAMVAACRCEAPQDTPG